MKLFLLFFVSLFGSAVFAETPYLECKTLVVEEFSETFVVEYENNLVFSDQLLVGPGFSFNQGKLNRSEYPVNSGPQVGGFITREIERRYKLGAVGIPYWYDREEVFGEEARYVQLSNSHQTILNPSLRKDTLFISESLLNGDSEQGHLLMIVDDIAGARPMLLSRCERILNNE